MVQREEREEKEREKEFIREDIATKHSQVDYSVSRWVRGTDDVESNGAVMISYQRQTSNDIVLAIFLISSIQQKK